MFSAGSMPKPEIHPLAKETLQQKYEIDTAALHPKSIRGFLDQHFDFVITVCDKAAETCPVFPGDPERIHWSFEDPSVVQGTDAQRRAFEVVASGLAGRLRIWMSLPDIRKRLDAERSHPASPKAL
ncbi:MAG: hypothetical protein PVSMB1_15300 [Gemmatimonadaceae bacterium]